VAAGGKVAQFILYILSHLSVQNARILAVVMMTFHKVTKGPKLSQSNNGNGEYKIEAIL